MIGTGRAADRDTALGLGADAFLDLQAEQLEDAGEVDVVFDVIGGDVLDRSAALVRAGGTLVTIAGAAQGPAQGRAGRSSSSSNPTAPGSPTSPSGCGTGGSSRSSGPCGRCAEAPSAFAPRPAHPRQDDHPGRRDRVTVIELGSARGRTRLAIGITRRIPDTTPRVVVVSCRVQRHVEALNTAVRDGRWPNFAERFTPNARMRFVGVPAGPFTGRDAIAAAYAQQPPTELLQALRVETDGDVDVVGFAWASGSVGTMRLEWAGDLVAVLEVSFDDRAWLYPAD